MTKKMDKKHYSDELNAWFGFKGDDKLDFSKMKEVDLVTLYAKTKAVEIAETESGDTGAFKEGIFGFGILRGDIIKKVIGNPSRREAIVKKVLDSLDADDLKKMEDRFGPLGKIATVLLGELG